MVFSRRLFINLALAGVASVSVGARLAHGRTESLEGEDRTRFASACARRAGAAPRQHQLPRLYRCSRFLPSVACTEVSLGEPRRSAACSRIWLPMAGVPTPLIRDGSSASPTRSTRMRLPPGPIERVPAMWVPMVTRCGSRDWTRLTATRCLGRSWCMARGTLMCKSISHFGMLGRSQGCFAVADSSLDEIMARLGPGRLIYADKA